MGLAPPFIFAFGPFTFDSASGELMRNGQRLRIAEQAARLLTILLERAGTVVTRDELRLLMWPNGEYLNHNHSISNAINQLRNILRDSSRAPGFIETIPKKGYRFVAEVKVIADGPGALATSRPAPLPHPSPARAPEPEPFELADTLTLALPEFPTPLSPSAAPRSRILLLWVFSAAFAALCLAAPTAFWMHRRPSPPQPDLYIGIAPLETSGPGAEQLAESFRLDLADAISQLPHIQVRADHSYSDNRQDAASVRSIAQTLQLDALLYGKLTLNGDRLTIQFELVRGRDAIHLASFRFTGTRDQLAAIRDQVQREVFGRLESSARAGGRMPGSTENTRAYQDYLQARYQLLQPTDESLAKAVQAFQAAVTLDAGFAKAYSGMATAYMLRGEHTAVPRAPAYDSARQFAARALALDPSEGEAHATLGFIAFRRDWDVRTGERELRRAIALEPSQAIHHVLLALLLGNTGRFDQGFQEIEAARADDPLWPPVYLTEMYLASSARQNVRAIAIARKLLALTPDWPLAHDQAAWTWWYAGHYEDAIGEWRVMASLEKDAARIQLEDDGLQAFRRGGVRAYARLRLKAIQSGRKLAHPNDFQPAEWYVNADQPEQAVAAIEEMVASHDPDSLQLAVGPAYQELHHNPRFLASLARVGLTLPRS